jgi:hypothetical protein
MNEPQGPGLRKRRLDTDPGTTPSVGAIDLATCATLAYSSEDPAHPVESILGACAGPGGPRWIAERPDRVEQIVLEFDRPQSISRLVYEAEETERERTQEVRIEASADGGQTYRQVLVQEYTFSPGGARYEREDLRVELHELTHLRLVVTPHKRGSGSATLSCLQLFA